MRLVAINLCGDERSGRRIEEVEAQQPSPSRKVSKIEKRAIAPEPDLLEAEGVKYAIRLPANRVLQERIGYLSATRKKFASWGRRPYMHPIRRLASPHDRVTSSHRRSR